MAHNEQVFTPIEIVKVILDNVGYKSDNNIRKKHIIDNSCGNGAFLCEVVSRYINACIRDKVDVKEITNELETYIHGIEIDDKLCEETHYNLMNICKEKDINLPDKIFFDIHCNDTLSCTEFNNKMDYVVGNPPYCKVHDLKEKYDKVKEYAFAENGMTDLYLVFFEIGIEMLNKNGVLGYITPNSWMTSLAGTNFRLYLNATHKLSKIIQFGHKQIFDKVTTFTNITIIEKSKYNNIFFYKKKLDEQWSSISFDKAFINGKLYLGSYIDLTTLSNITNSSTYHKIKVKNGFATLNDKLFILHNNWDKMSELSKNIIPIWKASKDKLITAIYPYNKEGKPLKYEDLDEITQEILKEQSHKLEIDITKEGWYLYGRYQGIKDMSKYRIGINNLINNNINSINLKLFKPYFGIYSGLYIVCEDDNNFLKNNYDKIQNLIISEQFIKYIELIGKYKNGGYYTFSSKDLENYLNYMILTKINL